MTVPKAKLELAFGKTVPPAVGDPSWVDVSAYLRADIGATINRGRPDEFSHVQVGSLAVSLKNDDGRFTSGRTGSPYYPNVVPGVPARLSVSTDGGATWKPRFTGNMNGWPQTWNGGNAITSTIQVTAADTFKALAQTPQLRSTIEQEVLLDDPAVYYTLGEPAGATAAADSSGNSGPSLNVSHVGRVGAGLVTFAAGTGPPTDGLATAQWASSADGSGDELVGRVSLGSGTSLGFEFWFVSGQWSNTLGSMIMISGPDGTAMTANPYYNSTFPSQNGFQFVLSAAGNVTAASDTITSAVLDDNRLHHVAFSVDTSTPYTGGVPGMTSQTVHVYVDGALADSVAVSGAAKTFTLSTLTVNNAVAAGGFGGSLGYQPQWAGSHVAVYAPTVPTIPSGSGTVVQTALPAARVAAHYTAGVTAFQGDLPGARITRTAAYAGLAVTVEAGSSPVAGVDLSGTNIADALQAVADADDGILWVDPLGMVQFSGRAHRYQQTAALTLAAGAYEPDLQIVVDDQVLVNQETVTYPSGPASSTTLAQTAVNPTSKAKYGWYANDTNLLLATADDALQAASWRVNMYGDPQSYPRVPTVTVDLLTTTTSLVNSALTVDVGSLIVLQGLPSQAPKSSLQLNVEGLSETVGNNGWTVQFNCTPALGAQTFVFNDSTRGVFNSPYVFGR